ncbi:MAG: hypothetical protein AUH29_06115 [Candidatus Rokubacteria bacterium 13_1_40CM_69_27]|nr:MAG: hypothetical protein AUH29_06115 [Candidatus Rokubacteria bacterium 13_1_40CM_69_27]OLC36155.1 MAG: hypothetical protein AUH81_08645 [Candidatus Rokubacteria bacterium 13_1_40CM_4_69_5]
MNEVSAACRQALEALLARGGAPSRADLQTLATLPTGALEEALPALATEHGAAAVPLLTALGSGVAERRIRRAAKRALYRLAQRGVQAPEQATERPPVVARGGERAMRAWLSGVDGSGSRAAWILFEGSYGALRLCSLILNDVAGILDAAGGDITKKRLDRELAELRASQKLPWVETGPARAAGLVAEALALHRAIHTTPPAAFARWQPLFETAAPIEPPAPAANPQLVERSAELLELPELAGWFLDPEAVQADAVELLQARESRLVVSDQLKAEREDAIVSRVVERELTEGPRRLWARRLLEMDLVFESIGREQHGALARAAAAALQDASRDVGRHPFARALAARALELAGQVALGRLGAAEVSRKPACPTTVPSA